jgi:hypothetical protein
MALLKDVGALALKWDRRPRPYPYAANANLQVLANVAADTWGLRAQVIPEDTFNFGDHPNYIQIEQLVIEDMSANNTWVMLFEAYNAHTFVFQTIGAVRFSRTAPQTRSFIIDCPARAVDNDDWSIWASVKSSGGGGFVTYSVSVVRCIPVNMAISPSTGVWPTG